MGNIYLIRHGEVAWNSEGAYIGSTDIPLNDTGRQQAALLEDRLSSKGISAIYSSDLSRALETAQIIAAPHALDVVSDERLRELDYGKWEGLSEPQILDSYAEEFHQWRIDIANVIIPGGESLNYMLERAYSAFTEIISQHADGSIVIVAHKSVNRAILCRLLDTPVGNYRMIGQENSCVNEIHVKHDGSLVINTINDRCHLRS